MTCVLLAADVKGSIGDILQPTAHALSRCFGSPEVPKLTIFITLVYVFIMTSDTTIPMMQCTKKLAQRISPIGMFTCDVVSLLSPTHSLSAEISCSVVSL